MVWYGDSVGNTVEGNSSIFPKSRCASCHQQGHAGCKALLQQDLQFVTGSAS